jgi:hypothetical protein
MAPTKVAPVVLRHPESGERHLGALKWGLVPYFTKDLKKARKPINARSETVATSGMFRAAFAKRRCLVPAPAYYEWRDDPDGGKTPFAVARVDGDPVAFVRGPANSPPEAGSIRHLRPVNSPPLAAGTEPSGEAEPPLTNNFIWQE